MTFHLHDDEIITTLFCHRDVSSEIKRHNVELSKQENGIMIIQNHLNSKQCQRCKLTGDKNNTGCSKNRKIQSTYIKSQKVKVRVHFPVVSFPEGKCNELFLLICDGGKKVSNTNHNFFCGEFQRLFIIFVDISLSQHLTKSQFCQVYKFSFYSDNAATGRYLLSS